MTLNIQRLRLHSPAEIANQYGLSESKVKTAIDTAMSKWGFSEEDAYKVIGCANDRYGQAMPQLLRVRNKDGQLVPMCPTRIHLKFKKYQRRIAYAVKPRQVFFTTFKEGDNFFDCIEIPGINTLFVNLDSRVTEEVFDRVHTFNREFALKPLLPSTRRETTRKLSWVNGSSFNAITVNNDGGEDAARSAGRSCTVQRVHGTEVAFWKHYQAFMSGMLDSVPKDGKIVLESTGNGAQGGFFEDVMEVVERGQLVAPGTWVLGDKSVHFFQWWEHPEYTRQDDPLPQYVAEMSSRHIKVLEESEAEHRAQMDLDRELTDEFKAKAINWRRGMLFSKGFLRDPDNALRIMDREYPGTLRHSFQSTGSAYLSLSLTDLRREEWKRHNKELGFPLSGMVKKTGDGKYTLWPGAEEVHFWAAPYDQEVEVWEERYCIGADVGGGNIDSDPDVIWVKDRVLNKYVAVSHGKWGPTKTADIMMALGYYYHRAKICWETNNHGVAVSIRVWDSKYPNVYRWDDKADTYKGMGFPTTETSRKHALALLKQVYEDRDRPIQIPYSEFYKEAAAFGPPAGKPDGKLEGQNGTNDDLIMGAAITEACSASMGEPNHVESWSAPDAGTFGAIREMVGGYSGGIRGIM